MHTFLSISHAVTIVGVQVTVFIFQQRRRRRYELNLLMFAEENVIKSTSTYRFWREYNNLHEILSLEFHYHSIALLSS